jgi:hypothetical protein
MKQWYGFVLVCWGILCLLLSLSQPIALNDQLGAEHWKSRFARWQESASGSPIVSIARSIACQHLRPGPLHTFVLDDQLTADDMGPPWMDIHGPPGPMRGLDELPVKPATQSSNSEPLHEISGSQPTPIEESGFCNRL